MLRKLSTSTGRAPELFARLRAHAQARRPALLEADRELSYTDLLRAAAPVTRQLRREGLTSGDRVGFLCEPGLDYCRTLLGIWHAGAVAVPLCVTAPPAELAYASKEAAVSWIKLLSVCVHALCASYVVACWNEPSEEPAEPV